jgi:phospholipid N-methyltransferase
MSHLQNIRSALHQILRNKPPHSMDDRAKVSPPTSGGRHDFPQALGEQAIGIELGVAGGYFSESILQNGTNVSRLYSVDIWGDHHSDREYVSCVARLAKYKNRSVVMRMDFNDAIEHFPDDFFDFIYIDAYAHEGQQSGQLLHKWWPKLKNGGVFAGHDYDPKWAATVSAVDLFCKQMSRTITLFPSLANTNSEDGYPSWSIQK